MLRVVSLRDSFQVQRNGGVQIQGLYVFNCYFENYLIVVLKLE